MKRVLITIVVLPLFSCGQGSDKRVDKLAKTSNVSTPAPVATKEMESLNAPKYVISVIDSNGNEVASRVTDEDIAATSDVELAKREVDRKDQGNFTVLKGDEFNENSSESFFFWKAFASMARTTAFGYYPVFHQTVSVANPAYFYSVYYRPVISYAYEGFRVNAYSADCAYRSGYRDGYTSGYSQGFSSGFNLAAISSDFEQRQTVAAAADICRTPTVDCTCPSTTIQISGVCVPANGNGESLSPEVPAADPGSQVVNQNEVAQGNGFSQTANGQALVGQNGSYSQPVIRNGQYLSPTNGSGVSQKPVNGQFVNGNGQYGNSNGQYGNGQYQNGNGQYVNGLSQNGQSQIAPAGNGAYPR